MVKVRLTEEQNVILVGIPNDKLESLKADPWCNASRWSPVKNLRRNGVLHRQYLLRLCPHQHQRPRPIEAAKELDQELNLPEELKIHWTGCPNTCGQAYMGAIGLTGTKAKNSEGVMGEGYTMTIGGSQGANPSIGEIHRKAIPADEIKAALKEVLIEKFGATPKA